MMNTSKQIMVLGMMRGGTSLATGIIHHLGIEVGKEFRSSSEKNPRGFFEDKQIFTLNQKILKDMGGSNCHNWNPPKEVKPEVAQSFTDELEALKRKKGIYARKCGFNFTLDVYLPYLSNPHLIITYRNPITNAISIQNYFGISFNTAYQHILIHYKQLGEVIKKDLPIYFFEFERARNKPLEVAQELADFIGIELKDKEIIKNFVYQKR